MTDYEPSHSAYQAQVHGLVEAATRTLVAANAHGLKPWWRGTVRYETYGHRPELRVGFWFELRDEPFPAGVTIACYRLVAMSMTPEGQYHLVGYAESGYPKNGAAIPSIDFSMLGKEPASTTPAGS